MRGSVLIAALALLVLVTGSAVALQLPLLIGVWYVAASMVAFFFYAGDKSAARQGRMRTAEHTLHACSLAGGWPGALIAQQVLRHKSRKRAFRVAFWGTVLINCSVLAVALVFSFNGVTGLIGSTR